MIKNELSTIEHTVLGIVWQFGPCTTYAVMRELRASSSTYYRNQASTTYPIVDRLMKCGFLRYCDAAIGARKDRLIEATEAGLSELRQWLEPPIPAAEVALSRDLVRLRVYFLRVLEPHQRKVFLEEAAASLKEQLAACEDAVRKHRQLEDPFIALADVGAVHETKARIAWLEEISSAILALP